MVKNCDRGLGFCGVKFRAKFEVLLPKQFVSVFACF